MAAFSTSMRWFGQAERPARGRRQQPVDLAEAEPAALDPAPHAHPARGDQADARAGEAEQDLDLDPAGDEVRPARIADRQIFEHLGAEADPLHVVGRGDSAPGQLAVDIIGRELDPHRPDDREGDEEQDEQRRAGDAQPPRPAPPHLRSLCALFVHLCPTNPRAPPFPGLRNGMSGLRACTHDRQRP